MDNAAIFQPLQLGPLTVKNRVLRSSVAGRFDNYDGSGTQVRINWDLKFARGGVGAIISSNAPVDGRGHIVPGYAYLDDDDKHPVLARARQARPRARLPVHRPARLRRARADDRRARYPSRRSARPTSPSRSTASGAAMTVARDPRRGRALRPGGAPRPRGRPGRHRARRRERDPLHAVPLARRSTTARTSTAARSRTGRGSRWRSCARSAREVGADFCLGFKISIRRAPRELLPWLHAGNPLEDVDHRSAAGSRRPASTTSTSAPAAAFPHPRNPAGGFPAKDVVGDLRHAALERPLRLPQLPRLPHLAAQRRLSLVAGSSPHRRLGIEGINLPSARAVKDAVSIPVLCTGGFQTASVIAGAIERGDCDGVTIARPLVANPDLVRLFERGTRPRAAAVHVLQQCLFALHRGPARLLRASAATTRARR